MIRSTTFVCFTFAASLSLTPALAHDPREHAKERAAAHAKAHCAAMKTMDMSKMDPKDPVAMALHKKCAAAGAVDSNHHDDDGHDHVHVHATAPAAAAPKPDDRGAY